MTVANNSSSMRKRLACLLLVIAAVVQLHFLLTFNCCHSWLSRTSVNNIQSHAVFSVTDDEHVWQHRSRHDTSLTLTSMHQSLNNKNIQLNAPMVVVTGTAGTGTRVLYDLLQWANVSMSRIVNTQRDSKIFIEYVKNDRAFGSPSMSSSIEDHQTLIKWMGESGRGVDYDLSQVNLTISAQISAAVDKSMRLLEFEASHRLNASNNTAETYWGFKEPQTMFTLPYLLNYSMNVRPHSRMTLVHVIRDGRDIAFSKQHRRKYQMHYRTTLEPFLPSPSTSFFNDSGLSVLEWSNVNIGRLWQWTNLGVKAWADRNSQFVNYIPIRLEDLCQQHTRTTAVERILRQLNVEYLGTQQELQSQLDAIISLERCHLNKYMGKDEKTVKALDVAIKRGLKFFGYTESHDSLNFTTLNSSTVMTVPGDFTTFVSNLPSSELPLIYTFVTDGYTQVLDNWLLHLKATGILNPVLVVTTSSEIASRPTLVNIHYYLLQPRNNATQMFKSELWSWRSRILEELIQMDRDVVMMDVDALPVVDDPFSFLTLPEFTKSDIIASRGRFPYSLNALWGATACMGFLYVKSSLKTKSFLRAFSEYTLTMGDDQVGFNHALADNLNPVWTQGVSKSLHAAGFVSVSILPFDMVPRYCKDDIKIHEKNNGQRLNTANQLGWVPLVYPSARILHCYTPKDGGEKSDWFERWGLWYL